MLPEQSAVVPSSSLVCEQNALNSSCANWRYLWKSAEGALACPRRWAFQGGLAIPSKKDPENVTLKTTGGKVIKNE